MSPGCQNSPHLVLPHAVDGEEKRRLDRKFNDLMGSQIMGVWVKWCGEEHH